MNGHIELVHERKKPFRCNIYDRSFFLKVNLNRDIKSGHEGKKPFKC